MAFVSAAAPSDTLVNLQRELARLYTTAPAVDLGISGRGGFPLVNVFGGKEGYVVCLEAPGLQLDHVSIESHGRTLTLKGERVLKPLDGGSFHRRERGSGTFARSLQLPADGDVERAVASYQHGMLTIRIPKRAEAQPRQISVQAS